MTTEAFFPAQSNAADWIWTGEVTDHPSAEPYDLSNVTGLTVKLRNERGAIALELSLGREITITDASAGEFSVIARASSMNRLCEGQYDVGVLMHEGEATTQIALGTLPIRRGL